MPFCKDCFWFGGYNGERYVCIEARNIHLDPVTGKMISYDCSWLRKLEHLCGEDGKWWKEQTASPSSSTSSN
jgi:hypothetical protein